MDRQPEKQQLDGPRALRPEEHQGALRFINALFRPEEPGTMEIEYPHVLGRDNIENMRVIVEDGEVISHSAIYFSTIRSRDLAFKVGGISAVGTHPDHRERGLAGSVVRDCIEVMRERGCHLSFLWTDRHDFYRSFGYEPSGSFYLLKPTASEFSDAPPDCDIVPYCPERLPEIISIHDREPFRTERTAEEYETFFSLSRTETLLALRDGKVSAYAARGRGRDLMGFMHDWGGEPRDLLRLASEHVALSGADDIYVLAPTHENAFTDLLADLGVQKAYMKLVMLSVIDVDGLSSVVSDYVGKRLGRDFSIIQDEDGIKLVVGPRETGEEALVEPARMLASVIFGPEPPSSFLTGFSDETLRALDAALPIPLFIWGMDWV
jgi:N-acetylglutamate synthase-like GNAT family acetyltransferase